MSEQPGVKSTPASNGRKTGLRFGLALLVSALSGLFLLLSFPPYGLWPLAWIGFVPYLFAQYRLFPSKWTSLGVAIANLVWLGPFLGRLFGMDFGFFFTFLGVWIALLNFLVSKDKAFHDLTRYRWLVPAGMAGFVGFEMVRASFIPLVATNGFIGYTQAMQAWLIQPVSLFSIYGLDLLILLVNYSLALALIAWYDRRGKNAAQTPVAWQTARSWLIAAGVALVAWTGLSLAIYLRPSEALPTLRVAALRPGLPLPAFQDEVNTDAVRFELFAGQARQAAEQGAQVLYTTEMMFNFDPQEKYTEEFRALARETGTYIFITYTVVQEGSPWRNEAVLLTPEGEFQPIYGKNHAFGEPPTAVRGVYPVTDTPLGRLATLICHDGNYTDVARRLAANGAQVIAAPLHEFGGLGEQYWTNAVFRAVENHTAVVVTGTGTVSAIINPNGMIDRLDLDPDGSAGVLVGDVLVALGGTLYTKIGDVLGWVSLAGFVFFIVFQAVVEGRAKKAAKGK